MKGNFVEYTQLNSALNCIGRKLFEVECKRNSVIALYLNGKSAIVHELNHHIIHLMYIKLKKLY